jgi:hypothetical protein
LSYSRSSETHIINPASLHPLVSPRQRTPNNRTTCLSLHNQLLNAIWKGVSPLSAQATEASGSAPCSSNTSTAQLGILPGLLPHATHSSYHSPVHPPWSSSSCTTFGHPLHAAQYNGIHPPESHVYAICELQPNSSW